MTAAEPLPAWVTRLIPRQAALTTERATWIASHRHCPRCGAHLWTEAEYKGSAARVVCQLCGREVRG